MSGTNDSQGILHDESGQFISLGKLFERERAEHRREHEQDRLMAKETALRLEREVEQTALRLERNVEETALRVQHAVNTALAAVAQTAMIHSEAHAKEHQAHERIHVVEKLQVDKAETVLNLRLDAMNEFRSALQDQSNNSVTRELFDQRAQTVDTRVSSLEKSLIGREVFNREVETLDEKIDVLNNWRSKTTGAALVLTLLAGVIGAAVMKILGGN